MKSTLYFAATTALAAGLLGCGSDFTNEPAGGAAGSGDSAGSGTATLLVSGHVDATESVDNGASSSQFQVELSVEVWRGSEPVDDATVEIVPIGGQPLVLQSAGQGTALYLGAGAGYHETYGIAVTAGSDTLSGAQVDGPDIHVFSRPTPGQVIAPETDLEVRWDRSSPADEATIETDELEETLIADEGSYTIDGAYFEGRDDGLEEDRLTIRRTNFVELAGGVPGSLLRVSLRNRVEFQIDLAP
ncbi:MAG: hypothetical protein JRI68_21630 [Deltaproteobacteria bacterium]|nr:hypothetical protein [Deltaproteobacteria bacterium]